MQDAELFIHLAEIAGVFVGFGTLLAFRTGELADLHAVEYLRSMVAGGLWVILSALAPLVLSRFGVEGHQLWVPCSLLALVLFIIGWVIDARSPESHHERSAHRTESLRYMAVALPLTLTMFGALILIVAGRWPEADDALYLRRRHHRAPGDRAGPDRARLETGPLPHSCGLTTRTGSGRMR